VSVYFSLYFSKYLPVQSLVWQKSTIIEGTWCRPLPYLMTPWPNIISWPYSKLETHRSSTNSMIVFNMITFLQGTAIKKTFLRDHLNTALGRLNLEMISISQTERSVCVHVNMPALDRFWADAASIDPVPAQCWLIMACLQGYVFWNAQIRCDWMTGISLLKQLKPQKL